ncbi:MAG: mechanosensitive ion channel family protein [Holophagales bacterium]|nr:mechanosensitive ion channel family protein [Holophagales bacterium]
MSPALLSALEAAGVTILVVAVFRLSHRSGLVSRIRFALAALGLLAAFLLLESQATHPGREALSKAALAALVLVAVHVVLQIADHVVWERILKPRHISVPRLLFDIVNALVLAGVAVTLLKVLYSFNLTGLLVTSTVLSAILGLSLQDVLSSLMAGIALQMESPLAPREWVRVGDKEGEVVQMNWRSLTLRSRDGHHVVLPNSRVAREDIVNFSRPGPAVMLHATIGVAYAHPPGEVKTVLEAAVAGARGVSASPPVEALVSRFADSAVEYDLRFWTRDLAGVAAVRDAALSRAWYALRRAGLAIPFPQREVALRQVPETRDDERLERRRVESFDALRNVETFRPLTDEQVSDLARHARLERYTAGEALVRQGDAGRSLFVVRTGDVRVEKADGGGSPRELARLGPGSFFGEMSLLTGEPRSASVVAVGEVEVVVVEKDAFSTLLHDDGHLARALSEALEERSRSQARVEAPAAGAAGPQAITDGLLDRIQRFFGLEG